MKLASIACPPRRSATRIPLDSGLTALAMTVVDNLKSLPETRSKDGIGIGPCGQNLLALRVVTLKTAALPSRRPMRMNRPSRQIKAIAGPHDRPASVPLSMSQKKSAAPAGIARSAAAALLAVAVIRNRLSAISTAVPARADFRMVHPSASVLAGTAGPSAVTSRLDTWQVPTAPGSPWSTGSA